jgi:hypothetical protein
VASSSSLVPFGGPNARCKDFDEGFGLGEEWLDFWRRQKRHAMNQAQPSSRFTNFFEAKAEFMNEVLPRFRTLQFSVVCERRRAASQKLIRHVSPSSACRQRIDQPNDANGVFK